MFAKTCWDRERNRYALPRARRLSEPQEPHHPRAHGRARRRADRRLRLAHQADRPGRARPGRDAALRYAGATRDPLSGRRLDHGRDRRPADRRDRSCRSPICSSSAWATASPPARATRMCRCASRPIAPPTTTPRCAGYPARIGDWRAIGDKKFIEENARWQDQACHRSLYSHQLRAALQLAIEDPHRAVTFVGVACSGAETVFGLFLRYKGHEWVPNPPELSQISALAEAQCAGRDAPDYDLPEAYHINGKVPELKGGLVLKKCDAEQGAQDRPAVPVDRRQRRRLLPAGRQCRAVRHVHAAQPGRLVRPRARLCRGEQPARRARGSHQVGQPRPAQPPARAVAEVRPRRS